MKHLIRWLIQIDIKLEQLTIVLTESPLSNYHESVHLSMNVGLNNTYIDLDWSQYEGFDVSQYMIFRR